jgi:antitoxin (DNA-binding transcriptional repressor) of toxin-antitoxin stability system
LIHFPAHWHDVNFSGVLPRGTPVAQCVPVKRESWIARIAPLTAEEAQRAHDLTKAISREPGLYRRKFRA